MSETDPNSTAIKLQHTWVLYYDEQTPQKGQQQNDYSERLKPLGTFSTVQEFWRYWNNLHVADFPINSNLRVFKQGIHPSWEDPINAHGGKWLIEVPQHKSTQAFMLTVLALIGEQFSHSDEICGAVFSVRSIGNRINVWNKNAHDNKPVLEKCEEDLRAALKPVQLKDFRYQPHRIDVGPAPKKEAQPSKTAQAAAAAAASASVTAPSTTNSSEVPPLAGGATDPPRSASKLAPPSASGSSGRANLTSSQGDEDDFESPFFELNAELKEKEKASAEQEFGDLGPAPPLSRHRKNHSMSSLNLPSSQEALSSSLTALEKRRLRRRGGRRSSSGNHQAAIAQALGLHSGESSAEPSPRDPGITPSSSSENFSALANPAAPTASLSSSTDQIMTPSITERKYLQRKRSVDRTRKSGSTDDEGGKRRLFSRPSRENLTKSSSRRSSQPGISRFMIVFLFFVFCVIIAVGLLSQYSCEHWGLYCT
eukprot:TRINITY_DN5097_c0_g1_i1.p1 TRINITY_DN5097_c0_g1~~TRINITY_DN5097_c0_g1_i1.p1  ORF type:complete len:481 (-),score=92.97 TRINITY_DN5097_c0_g1_i1:37-1479(-)